MEITSFVLGMLTIVAVIILTVIVVGMVKISKLEKKSHNLYELCSSIEGDLRCLISETNRDITMVEKTIMNRIDQTRQEMDRAIDETHRAMAEISHSDRSYIDSRIDKVVARGSLDGSKQILNG
jgi:outer membrane murein-binding lipoprotein Lpp